MTSAAELTGIPCDEHDAAVQPADRQAAVEPAEGHAEERGGGEVVGEGHKGGWGILMDDAINIGYKATLFVGGTCGLI